ncbi:MAG: class I SAM-dependent methyltransferase [Bacteroidales bacterium]|nr:class I SAM-dependent methyltransferase [Bacteroidales bacterium]MBQ5582413.1 class I SAM-dependent methyltransferase [Bacteroidales bacterium]
MESSLNKYLKAHSSVPSEMLSWLEKQTHLRTNYGRMLSGSVQGELLKLLVEISGAQRILEIGSFTGYSSTCMALGLKEDGSIDALELNDELEDLMREAWEKAGVEDKINLHIGDASKTLESFADRLHYYDFVFIDANKREYSRYYDLVFPLVKVGGIIVADDVLWDGKVLEENPSKDAQTQGLLHFNDMVAEDRRVEKVMIPLRDGLTIIVKKSD